MIKILVVQNTKMTKGERSALERDLQMLVNKGYSDGEVTQLACATIITLKKKA